MKFPILSGRHTALPKKPVCPRCGKRKVLEPHSMAIFDGGALFVNRKKRYGGLNDQMDGFVGIAWHGAHDTGIGTDRDIFTSVYAALDCRGGQFEIYFCSTACLRAFFNSWVDALEAQIQRQKRKNKQRRRR